MGARFANGAREHAKTTKTLKRRTRQIGIPVAYSSAFLATALPLRLLENPDHTSPRELLSYYLGYEFAFAQGAHHDRTH
jgi:hypothetical protein